MKRNRSLIFFVGLLIGGMACLIVWYWQKSTSAEDGALALLDRLAAAEKRVRQLSAELATRIQEPAPLRFEVDTRLTDELPSFLAREAEAGVAEDLTRVKGIGPVFDKRLQDAGIDTVAKLRALSTADLANILQISETRAANILAVAREA